MSASVEDVGHVLAEEVKLHDDPPAGLDAVPRLDRRRSPGTWRHLAERDAGRDLGRRSAAASARSAARAAPMDGGVLADLERREVEPERRRPASAGRRPRPTRPARGRRRRSASCDLGELRVQLVGRGVPARQRRRLAGQRRARPAQPLGDEPEPLAVRLVGEPAAQLPVDLGQRLGVARQPRREMRVTTRSIDDGRGARLHRGGSRRPRSRGGRVRPGCAASAR